MEGEIIDQTLADQEKFDHNFPKVFSCYRVVKVINHGSFSVVCLVENIRTLQQYACKIVSRQTLRENETIQHFEQEIRFHQSLKHKNICQLYEIVYEQDFIFLIMEYCANGELFELITKRARLPQYQIRKYFSQLVAAVNYIHSKNIAHRDLKLENIYLTEDMDIRLGDFGFSHSTEKQALLSTSCGSIYYVAPEVIRGEQYDGQKSDIWSLGVILYIMSTSALPWTEQNQSRLFQQIVSASYKIPQFVSPEAGNIIQSCLNPIPSKRPSAADLMSSSYVEGYFKNADLKEDQNRNTTSFSVVKKRALIIRPNPASGCRASLNQTNSLIMRINDTKRSRERRATQEAPVHGSKLLESL
ncbi:CAMK family protein kinase [Trichomonas vaginalis G3]|uniref:CAMK family protein kinase n=1 Tax=Trichomonas vaginalis (strain ATCC PRA-98 / G3) TaxID=412133 RepID=A2ENP4_TRIV3|nr:protein serine/threonine kinase protein [Trichomonas vaginalis G3]EAY05744.1 CAMK family protein kinase [Trichomonas vaginalis G3]KAI5535143.1 protein serine/threonine kinase protein [Trichomonas vaginalis G3]|eukprot:XP_001317967.1 CAMK family protein kinase [Trichomonas vaginalis G3]